MTDIVEQLNAMYECEQGDPDFAFIKEAANEIERLRKEIERLKERNYELGWIVSPERMGR